MKNHTMTAPINCALAERDVCCILPAIVEDERSVLKRHLFYILEEYKVRCNKRIIKYSLQIQFACILLPLNNILIRAHEI